MTSNYSNSVDINGAIYENISENVGLIPNTPFTVSIKEYGLKDSGITGITPGSNSNITNIISAGFDIVRNVVNSTATFDFKISHSLVSEMAFHEGEIVLTSVHQLTNERLIIVEVFTSFVNCIGTLHLKYDRFNAYNGYIELPIFKLMNGVISIEGKIYTEGGGVITFINDNQLEIKKKKLIHKTIIHNPDSIDSSTQGDYGNYVKMVDNTIGSAKREITYSDNIPITKSSDIPIVSKVTLN